MCGGDGVKEGYGYAKNNRPRRKSQKIQTKRNVIQIHNRSNRNALKRNIKCKRRKMDKQKKPGQLQIEFNHAVQLEFN